MSAMSEEAPCGELPGDPLWVRSSYSTGMNNCVETARLGAGRLAVRDSKDTGGAALLFADAAWESFLTSVQGQAPNGSY
ncbi:DUF397 domain-containing protein [Streptomyces daliensis]|uniref:DUF397 domain-containing protein n=1 Tax=Streptomyces daliensis TaxID=299421 RepID=A0A8T4IQQ9_9ACTN|nr:DUF397 domain-containing protein [Streptomyces daliensis]